MTHSKIDTGDKACYAFYRQKQKINSEINKRKFKNRILKIRRSKPNPKMGGWFVSNYGSPENTGLKFNSPIDVETFLDLEIDPRDRVYFEAGQIYNLGEYDITAANVTIGRYGTGNDPIINGSSSISGLTWTAEGGDLYSAPVAVEPLWVIINNRCAEMAQSSQITITSRPSTTEIGVTHATVSGFPNLVGSYLVARESNFKFSRLVTVTAYNGAGTITIDNPISVGSGTVPNIDLVLMNREDYLTADFNQWYWESGTLYVRAAASPSTMNIRVVDYDYAFKDQASTTFRDLDIRFYMRGLVSNTGVTDAQNLLIRDVRDAGVCIEKAVTGINISNNTFLRCGNNGIIMRSCTNSTFSDNSITDTGVQDNYGWHTWQSGASYFNQVNGCGIVQVIDPDDDTVTGTGCVYERNTILNTAYCGISQAVGSDEVIRYNNISDICNRLIDGGGIYTFHYRTYNVPNDNAVIAYNIVTDTNHAVGVIGIYCDNRTTNANVHHNTVSGFEWGILLNFDTTGHTVEDNNLIDNTYGVVFRMADNVTIIFTPNIDNQFNRNVIGMKLGQKALYFLDNSGTFTTWNPFSGTGGADNNTYIKNAGNTTTKNQIADSTHEGNNLTFAQLQTAYGEDAASVKITENPVIFTNATGTTSNEDANSYYKDFSDVAVEAYTIDPYYSRILNELNYSNQFVAASTQYYNAGTTADIQFTHTSIFSIIMRFKIAANPAGVQTLFDNRNASNRGYCVQVLTDGRIQCQYVNTVTTNRLQVISSADLCDNAWHQVIFSYTSTTNTLDVDGVLDTPTVVDNLTATFASTNDLNIGRNTQGGTNYFDGLLDEISIWTSTQSGNRAIHWNGGKAIDVRTLGIGNPIHYWRMGLADSILDEGTGTSLDLTPVNSPTASTDAP